MHPAVALQDLHEGLELEVSARSDASAPPGLIGVPVLHILLRIQKGLPDHVLHAHTRGRVAIRIPITLGVLTERKFDTQVGAIDHKIVGVRSPAQLNDSVTTTNGVG